MEEEGPGGGAMPGSEDDGEEHQTSSEGEGQVNQYKKKAEADPGDEKDKEGMGKFGADAGCGDKHGVDPAGPDEGKTTADADPDKMEKTGMGGEKEQ